MVRDLTKLLDPTIKPLIRRAHKEATRLRALAPEYSAESCFEDDFDDAHDEAETAGFYIGVVFGARLAGYSRKEMKKLGKGLFKAMAAQLQINANRL